MIKKPMLSGTVEDLNLLTFPKFVSPKLDGIRCVKVDGKALTRKFKPVPNHYVRNFIEQNLPDGLDGELILSNNEPFNEISSGIMSEEGEPNFLYCLFDFVESSLHTTFAERYGRLVDLVNKKKIPQIQVVEHKIVGSADDVLRYHKKYVEQGYEGLMIRDPASPYKNGRSTNKEQYLLKLKTFFDDEAEIIGFLPFMKNNNEKEKDELGHSKRSSAKDGLVKQNKLGSFQLRFNDGTEFGCGSGFTEEQRIEYWKNQKQLTGKLVKVKYQNKRKVGESPRFPIFIGFRHKNDM